MPKDKNTIWACSACGEQSAKWYGRCPSCGEWNTLTEETFREPPPTQMSKAGRARGVPLPQNRSLPLSAIEEEAHLRVPTGIGEFDRVLGGGMVAGSVVLLSGEPGVGKSTLLLQICAAASHDNRILYVSGEETRHQIKLRAKRLGVVGDGLYILNETDVGAVVGEIYGISPKVVIIDSIQTMRCDELNSSPGSAPQIRESAAALIAAAKAAGICVFIVGHITKEGSIAGPKILEHMVDVVLYFEGERRNMYRLLRANKNRYGPASEIGVFEMRGSGLEEVPNPSEMLLAGRIPGVAGNCAACFMEGSRPIIAEIQALAAPTPFPSPRRTASGVDYNRMCLLIAILEKRMRMSFANMDTYVNVTGGLRLDEPSGDLAVILALASTLRDVPVDAGLAAVGEVGLAGEVRPVIGAEASVAEAARLGFKKIIVPAGNKLKQNFGEARLLPVKSIFEALGHASLVN